MQDPFHSDCKMVGWGWYGFNVAGSYWQVLAREALRKESGGDDSMAWCNATSTGESCSLLDSRERQLSGHREN